MNRSKKVWIREPVNKRKAILFLLNCLVFFIFVDLVGTIVWVTAGLALEANPVMDYFLRYSPVLFAVVKLGLSFTGIYVLYLFRRRFRKIIFYSSLALTLIYLMVALHHLKGIVLLFH